MRRIDAVIIVGIMVAGLHGGILDIKLAKPVGNGDVTRAPRLGKDLGIQGCLMR